MPGMKMYGYKMIASEQAEFRERINNVYAHNPIRIEYSLVADLFEARYKRLVG